MIEQLWNVVGSIPTWVYVVLGVIAFYAAAITLWAGMMPNARDMENGAKNAPDSPLRERRQ